MSSRLTWMGPSTPFLTPHLHRWQTHCGLSHGLRRNREVLSAKIYSRVIIREREKKEKGRLNMSYCFHWGFTLHQGYTVKVFKVSWWQQLCKWKDSKAKRQRHKCIVWICRQAVYTLFSTCVYGALSIITPFHFLCASLSACLSVRHSIISLPILHILPTSFPSLLVTSPLSSF